MQLLVKSIYVCVLAATVGVQLVVDSFQMCANSRMSEVQIKCESYIHWRRVLVLVLGWHCDATFSGWTQPQPCQQIIYPAAAAAAALHTLHATTYYTRAACDGVQDAMKNRCVLNLHSS